MPFDVSQVPFSRFGSYLSIMFDRHRNAPDRTLYIRHHRDRSSGNRTLMRLTHVDGSPFIAAQAQGTCE